MRMDARPREDGGLPGRPGHSKGAPASLTRLFAAGCGPKCGFHFPASCPKSMIVACAARPSPPAKPPEPLLLKRIVPIVLAVALFMETMDATVIATSLPVIAADLGTSPIALKLALTSYYVSLAIFIPVSGRLADRLGPKLVFRAAIAVFMLGSLACAMAFSIEGFVAARFLQGIGGAMMTPVGRLLLVRAVPQIGPRQRHGLVHHPGADRSLIGPPLGGAISTYADWRWIFLINLPIGIAGILLATRFLPAVDRIRGVGFDCAGFPAVGICLRRHRVRTVDRLAAGACRRIRRPARGGGRGVGCLLRPARQTNAEADPAPVAAQGRNPARHAGGRVHLPNRFGGGAVSAAVDAATGARLYALAVGAGVERLDGRCHHHEIPGQTHSQAIRLPKHADRRVDPRRDADRPDRGRGIGRLDLAPGRHALGRRLLSIAILHRDQRACLRRL